LRGSAVNLELFYVLIALIMVFFFYRRNLLYLLEDKKETMQMLLIFALVACLVYVICDYVLMWCRTTSEIDSMKRLLVIFFTVLPIASFANESHCYSIKNSDQKNYCLALAKHQVSYCYSLQESDSKNLCLAQIKNQKSYCYSIKASDSKNQCLAMVK